jgi:serine/threonine protein kinase
MGNCMKPTDSSGNTDAKAGIKKNGSDQNLKSNQKLGAKELKYNYQIDSGTTVLGTGAFGKVFQTYNKHKEDLRVAIKVMNKNKLEGHLEAI